MPRLPKFCASLTFETLPDTWKFQVTSEVWATYSSLYYTLEPLQHPANSLVLLGRSFVREELGVQGLCRPSTSLSWTHLLFVLLLYIINVLETGKYFAMPRLCLSMPRFGKRSPQHLIPGRYLWGLSVNLAWNKRWMPMEVVKHCVWVCLWGCFQKTGTWISGQRKTHLHWGWEGIIPSMERKPEQYRKGNISSLLEVGAHLLTGPSQALGLWKSSIMVPSLLRPQIELCGLLWFSSLQMAYCESHGLHNYRKQFL